MQIFTLKSLHDGLDLSVLVVRPDGEVRAVLQILHGMCGSKERYIPFMSYMSARGIACVAHDHRGHGGTVLSDDDLGYMYEEGHDALVDDIHVVNQSESIDRVSCQGFHKFCFGFGPCRYHIRGIKLMFFFKIQ